MTILRSYPAPGGWRVIPIHYSMDPTKDAAWAAAEREKYARDEDWLKEMEIDFRARAGRPAYPSYNSAIHLVSGLQYVPSLPLCLCCDFNVAPAMVWEVAQIVSGVPQFVGEIVCAEPATVERSVREFRNMFPAHGADVRIYGDQMGSNRDPQTGRSNYALMKLNFSNYGAELDMRVPAKNPEVVDRLNAVNRMLRGKDGLPGIKIDPAKCPELVRDFEEVVLAKEKEGSKGNRVEKTYDTDDPYSWRTHASDAVGYFVCREWSVAMETYRSDRKAKARPPLVYERLLGE